MSLEHEREEMVSQQLAARGVREQRVLDAMRRVPREMFLPPELRDRAYDDAALPIDAGQTISQPYIVACMTELLSLRPGDRVLEVGTGSGYQTAILALLAQHIYSIERHEVLLEAAQHRLRSMELSNVTFRWGDGSLGWQEEAPFDAILVAAGAPDVPRALLAQMTIGGRLVLPIGPLREQQLLYVFRATKDRYVRREVLGCRFVKLVGAGGWGGGA